MRRWSLVAVMLLVVLAGIAIGVGAYHAGYDHGLEASGRVTQIVREVGPRGFFPFGLFLFPLFIIGIFLLIRAAFWGRYWHGPGRWGSDHEDHGGWPGPRRFEEWHRRQHEQATGDHPGAGGEPAGA
jgi:hypothetical protein